MRWLATVHSSCSSRPIPQRLVEIAWCSPIERPVRGSSLRGIRGTIWPGRSRVSSARRSRAELRAVEVEQQPAQVLVDLDRRVARWCRSRRRPRPRSGRGRSCWRRGSSSRGRCRRPAGRRRRASRASSARAEHALAGQVEVVAVLEHAAGRDLAEPLALRGRSGRRARRARSVNMSWFEALRVGPVLAGERDPVAAEDGGRWRWRCRRLMLAVAYPARAATHAHVGQLVADLGRRRCGSPRRRAGRSAPRAARRGCRTRRRARPRPARSSAQSSLTWRVIAFARVEEIRPCSWNQARSRSISASACRSQRTPRTSLEPVVLAALDRRRRRPRGSRARCGRGRRRGRGPGTR